MTIDNKFKVGFGFLSIVLLTTILIKLTNVPGGMILSGLVLGIMWLVVVLFACSVVTVILKFIFKNNSSLTLFSIVLSLALIIFHYHLYSPTLKIKVPNGYSGEINLVLSNVKENILTIDTNGIGYVNEWTFEKTYSRPIVEQLDGKNLGKSLVGFNNSSFWGKSIGGENSIRTMSFDITPSDTTAPKTYTSKDWTSTINKKLVLLKNPEKGIESNEITIEIDPE